MNTKINTAARFLISAFFIADGIALMNSFHQASPLSDISESSIFFIAGCIQLVSGIFLFLGYKVSIATIVLVISTFLTLFLQNSALNILQNLALLSGLVVLISNNAGETFWEYAQVDIDDLPNYKVKM